MPLTQNLRATSTHALSPILWAPFLSKGGARATPPPRQQDAANKKNRDETAHLLSSSFCSIQQIVLQPGPPPQRPENSQAPKLPEPPRFKGKNLPRDPNFLPSPIDTKIQQPDFDHFLRLTTIIIP